MRGRHAWRPGRPAPAARRVDPGALQALLVLLLVLVIAVAVLVAMLVLAPLDSPMLIAAVGGLR